MASLDPVWIKIADFGVSKHAKNTSLRTRAGTQGYLAPEILGCNPKKFKTQGLIPHALDVWSLGCLVYELIAFEPPFLDQEPDEEDEPATGVEAWPTSEPREFDFACLREYCDSGLEFPAALLKQSDLPVGEEEEAFIRSLSVPSPMARPAAANSLQGPRLRGLDYTSGRIEFWKNEFLQLGVELDFGKENILMRQVDVGDIYQFLPKGANGSVSDLLMVAARKSRKEALERLLKSPSCLESIGSVNRVKLFQQAIETGQRDMVQRLLQHKAFAGASFGDKSVQGWAVEVAGDDGEMVKVILEHTSDLCGALLLAVKSGDVDIVRTVLGRDPEKEVFDTGDSLHTPLREAVKEGYLDIVKLLLNEGTNINFPAPYDAGRRTLLQTAAAHGHVEIVKYLLDKGANVNGLAERDGGRTALQAASELGHVEIINLLLKNGANVNSPAAYTNGWTALQAAVEREHLDAIKILLDSGANVNGSAGAEGGKTALQAAARCGNLEIVKILLASGADVDADGAQEGGGEGPFRWPALADILALSSSC
jgi:ankyrin repeat protein